MKENKDEVNTSGSVVGTLTRAEQIEELGAAITQVVAKHPNITNRQRAGRVAEVWHAETYNLKAKGTKAFTTESLGKPRAKADIIIKKGSEVVAKAQVKYNRKAAETAFNISSPNYDGMEKIVASNQVKKVKEISAKANKRVGNISKNNYKDTAKKASGSLKGKSVELSNKEARALASGDQAIIGKMRRSELVAGIGKAAAIDAGVSVVLSVANSVRGEVGMGEGARRAVKVVVPAAADGAAKAAACMAAKTLLKRAGPAAVVGTSVIDAGKNLYKYLDGEMSFEDAAIDTGKSVAITGATVAIAFIPVVGLPLSIVSGWGLSKLFY